MLAFDAVGFWRTFFVTLLCSLLSSDDTSGGGFVIDTLAFFDFTALAAFALLHAVSPYTEGSNAAGFAVDVSCRSVKARMKAGHTIQ